MALYDKRTTMLSILFGVNTIDQLDVGYGKKHSWQLEPAIKS